MGMRRCADSTQGPWWEDAGRGHVAWLRAEAPSRPAYRDPSGPAARCPGRTSHDFPSEEGAAWGLAGRRGAGLWREAVRRRYAALPSLPDG